VSSDPYDVFTNIGSLNSSQLQHYSPVYDRTIPILLPEGCRQEMSLTVNTPAQLVLNNLQLKASVVAMAAKMPSFEYSAYRTVAYNP
jgi:hypothetical protein